MVLTRLMTLLAKLADPMYPFSFLCLDGLVDGAVLEGREPLSPDEVLIAAYPAMVWVI